MNTISTISRVDHIGLSVRRAAAADVGSLVLLMHDFYAEANFPLDHDWAASAFTVLLANPELGRVWIAHAGTQPIGHAVLTIRYAMEFGGLAAYIRRSCGESAIPSNGYCSCAAQGFICRVSQARLQIRARGSRSRQSTGTRSVQEIRTHSR
jgi:hypothetical protein